MRLDQGRLVDVGFHLLRADDQAVFGEAEIEEGAVVGLIRARRQVGDHVGLAVRCVGQDGEELFFGLAGEPANDIEGPNRRGGAALRQIFLGDVPEVRPKVENGRVRHVEIGKALGLPVE